jgi:hypothetical protein
MAIILTELYEANILVEAEDAASGKGRRYIIEGVYMQSEQGNKNGRIYPKQIMEREVAKYIQTHVSRNRATGELNHPANRVNVDPKEASHKITELRWDGDNVMGRSVIMDTPMGKIVKAHIDEGVEFGVSSRALGSLKKRQDGLNEVQADFDLRTIDIVSDPSAPDAWMTAIMEGKEWTNVNGIWTEANIDATKSAIQKATRAQRDARILEEFNKFMNSFK